MARMRMPKSLGLPVLGVYLIATGLIALLKFHLPSEPLVMAVLAIVAGVLIMLGR